MKYVFVRGSMAMMLAALASLAGNTCAQRLPADASGTERRSHHRRLERPTVDAGDSYTTLKGPRRLLRMAGTVVVRADEQADRGAAVRRLTETGAPLADWTVDWQAGKGFTVLKAARGERLRELSSPARLGEALKVTRRTAGLRSANPVFVDPQRKLWLIPTAEIIVNLRTGTDPQAYFGAEWPRARQLSGRRGQFVLTLTTDRAEDMLAEVNRRSADPRVAWAEPNFLSQTIRQSDDPYFPFQWHLNNSGQGGGKANADVNAPEAWTSTTGSREVVIAMLDDGVEIDHSDLALNIFVNASEDGFDADGNGYVGDFNGWNFYADTNDPRPADFLDDHGTSTAGVAAAAGDNLRGGAGIAPGCLVMPLKVTQGEEGVSFDTLAEAIYYAAGSTRDGQGLWRGADVISISLGFEQSQVVDDALNWAVINGRDGYGCPVFAAAGNDASRWQPTRLKIPVGRTLGAGTFSFGFEYRKDEIDSDGEDLVKIDNVVLLRGDNFTQVNSALGPGGRQDFEGAVFPPTGWEVFGDPAFYYEDWTATTNRALTGTGGRRSAQSGFVQNNSWNQLATPNVTLQGDEILSLSCYASSEINDGLYVFAYDAQGYVVQEFAATDGFPLVSGSLPVFDGLEYPARHPDVSGVGASTDMDLRADYSQTGSGLDFVAPSSGGWRDVLTTDRVGTNGYSYQDYEPSLRYTFDFGGTSSSTPLAAGVGALLLAANPYLYAEEVRAALRVSCAKIGGVTYADGWNPEYGYGRLNAKAALKHALPNLRLQVTEFPNPTAVGGELFYTLAVTNRGFFTGFDVWVEVDLPADLPLVDGSVTYDYVDNHLTLYLGDLAAGEGTEAWVSCLPLAAGAFTNEFYASSVSLDFKPADDATNVITRVLEQDLQPPTVAILTPTAGGTVNGAGVLVQGTANDATGVSTVEVWINDEGDSALLLTNRSVSGNWNWSALLANVPPGTNTLRVRAWDASGNASSEITRGFFCSVLSPLRVNIRGSGSITPNWTNQLLEVNRGYTLLAVPAPGFLFSNWMIRPAGLPVATPLTTSPSASFLMQSNLTLRVNFVPNPFLAVTGSYSGLFYAETGVEHQSSGYFSLVLKKSGNYSAELQLAGERFGLSGKFALDGRATNVVTPTDAPQVQIEWALRFAGGSYDLSGRVFSTGAGWDAVMLGDRAPAYGTGSSPFLGKYTLVLPGTGNASDASLPFGDSIGTAKVEASGMLNLGGNLADNTPFSQSAHVSSNGIWPLYVSLYGGHGSLLGWVTLNTNLPPTIPIESPRVSWIKPAVSNDTFYSDGYQFETSLVGSRYRKTSPLLPLTNAVVVFTGGNLETPVTNVVLLTSSNTVLNLGPNPLSMTLMRSNGTFSGTLTLSDPDRALPFQGVLLQVQTNGSGFFVGTNQSGKVHFGH